MDDPRTALSVKLAEIDEQMAEMERKPVDQGSISFGKRIGEGTSMAVDRLAQVAVHDRLQLTRADVSRAMAKLDEGTYGTCDVCGKQIPPGRLEALPDVPSLKDAGYNAEYAQWSGLFVPSATPEPVVQRLRAAARSAGNDARVKEVIGNAGSPVMFQDTPDFEKYVQSDVRRMGDVVRKIGKVE